MNRSISEAFQRAAFQTAAEQAVQKRVFKPHMVDAGATWTIDALIVTVPVTEFNRQEADWD